MRFCQDKVLDTNSIICDYVSAKYNLNTMYRGAMKHQSQFGHLAGAEPIVKPTQKRSVFVLLRIMKELEEFDKLVNGKTSLADESSQGAWLEFLSPTGNTEMTPISVVKDSVPPSPVVEVKASSPEGFDGIIPAYHRQLCHQTATLGDTSTSSVSIVRGSPSALRSSRQQPISLATSSGVSSGRGIWCLSLRAKIPSIASLMLARASSRLSPWLTQPGRTGQWMEYPVSSGSRITVNFITAFNNNPRIAEVKAGVNET